MKIFKYSIWRLVPTLAAASARKRDQRTFRHKHVFPCLLVARRRHRRRARRALRHAIPFAIHLKSDRKFSQTIRNERAALAARRQYRSGAAKRHRRAQRERNDKRNCKINWFIGVFLIHPLTQLLTVLQTILLFLAPFQWRTTEKGNIPTMVGHTTLYCHTISFHFTNMIHDWTLSVQLLSTFYYRLGTIALNDSPVGELYREVVRELRAYGLPVAPAPPVPPAPPTMRWSPPSP